MTDDDRIEAVHALIALTDRERARAAARELSGRLSVAELLRAADGAQQVARALAALDRDAAREPSGQDEHDIRSLYS